MVMEENLKFEFSGVSDDFGDADLALGLIGRVLEHRGLREALVRRVIAHFPENGTGVCGRLDAGNVEFRQGFDLTQDGFELGLESGDLFVGEFEAGEIGDVANVDVAVRHGRERLEMKRVFQVPSADDEKDGRTLSPNHLTGQSGPHFAKPKLHGKK
jgi:hypothetical protein